MALVVFLRGVNVGGNRTFRPSVLAKELSDYDVVNIGAAGTFVVRKPAAETKVRAEFVQRLPFETEIMICNGRELARVVSADPFPDIPTRPDIVRFVSVLGKSQHTLSTLPVSLPPQGEWLLKIVSAQDRFLFGVYRRQMKAIGYLGQIDK